MAKIAFPGSDNFDSRVKKMTSPGLQVARTATKLSETGEATQDRLRLAAEQYVLSHNLAHKVRVEKIPRVYTMIGIVAISGLFWAALASAIFRL